MEKEKEKESCLRVRKGAWTKEEDDRLKHCMHESGEGTWHKVPSRAGLNRCPRSCRMRWLNYLKPDINNGEFTEDEVDLLIRLHKLLGNRWSLIAGRLPGRTANAVKNYWNTHLRKKVFIPDNEKRVRSDINDPKNKIIKSNYLSIIKPRPRIFSKHLLFRMNKPTIHRANKSIIQPQNNHPTKSTYSPVDHEETRFWGSWFDGDQRFANFSIGQDPDQAVLLPELTVGEDVLIHEDHQKCYRDSTIDMDDLWRLLDADGLV